GERPRAAIRHRDGAAVIDPISGSEVALQRLTRSRYSPVRVSMRMTSPSLMKSGTCTSAPVSSVAGVLSLVAGVPRRAGSRFHHAQIHEVRQRDADGALIEQQHLDVGVVLEEQRCLANRFLGNVNLLV